jgi:hypothetical protein
MICIQTYSVTAEVVATPVKNEWRMISFVFSPYPLSSIYLFLVYPISFFPFFRTPFPKESTSNENKNICNKTIPTFSSPKLQAFLRIAKW